jgi:hypothetical protein
VLVLLAANAAAAGDEVTRIQWSELKAQGSLELGEIVASSDTAGSVEELLIAHDSDQPLTARLVTLEPTGINSNLYTLRGQIRYENVSQPGYLEMWNYFANGGSFFSRTAAASGPMGIIVGTSTTREFILPFQSDPQTGPPEKLEVNLVLPSSGRVWIGPLTLTEFSEAEWASAMQARGAWWSPQTGGLVGGLLGCLMGLMGAVVGTLCSFGRCRTLCLATCWTAIGMGVVCLIAGTIALTQQQPYEVYYPLLLTGVIATSVVGGLIRTVRKRFEEAELRKMASMDAGVEV